MDFEYTSTDFTDLSSFYFEFLEKRSEIVKNKFLSALGYLVDENSDNKTRNTEIYNTESFSEKFFRLEKIGVVVRTAFIYLLQNDMLTKEDIFKLKDRDYCRTNLGCAYPVITEFEENTRDNNGKSRYWAEPIIVNNHTYYICSEWYEHDRKSVVPWIKNKINEVHGEYML